MKKLIVITFILIIGNIAFAQKSTQYWSNENVQSISGIITDNSRPCAFLKTSDGISYKVHLGPRWYWSNNDYTLNLEEATIKGNVKMENGEYNIYPFTILQSGKTMIIADDNGVPKWRTNNSGKGNRNGNGNGNGNCVPKCNRK